MDVKKSKSISAAAKVIHEKKMLTNSNNQKRIPTINKTLRFQATACCSANGCQNMKKKLT